MKLVIHQEKLIKIFKYLIFESPCSSLFLRTLEPISLDILTEFVIRKTLSEAEIIFLLYSSVGLYRIIDHLIVKLVAK